MPETKAPPLLDPQFLPAWSSSNWCRARSSSAVMKGERRSKRKGQSVEFADYRNYVIGDDLRHLDWNLYARLDRLFIRLFQEEEDLHFYFLIDNSLSMDFGTPSKLHYARQIAAALALSAWSISIASSSRRSTTASRRACRRCAGREELWRMLDFLNKIEPAGPSDLRPALKTFSLKCSGKGIVVLLSDFMDKGGYEDALRYLIARQFDVYRHSGAVPGGNRAADRRRSEAGRCRGRGRRRDHRAAPLLKRYKQEPGGVSRQPQRILRATRHHVPVHGQPGAV